MDRIRAALFDHRRALAAICVALAVLSALQSVRSDSPGRPVLVAARDLPSGHVVTAPDVRTVSMTSTVRPADLLDRRAAVGRRVAGPMRAGEPITDWRVIEPRDLSGHGDDAVLTMVRLDDEAQLVGLRVGDRVDVVASSPDAESPARVVARGATIAVIPEAPDDRTAPSLGVVTPRAAALDLAASRLESRLGILVLS